MKKISKLRGMQDTDPIETTKINFVENSFNEISKSYGYQEVRFPIIESTDLFKRSVGDQSDIVCLLYTSPSPRDPKTSRMPSSA